LLLCAGVVYGLWRIWPSDTNLAPTAIITPSGVVHNAGLLPPSLLHTDTLCKFETFDTPLDKCPSPNTLCTYSAKISP
jgi:hypothetical protein